MRKLFVTTATVAIFALLVSQAFAAKGGGGRVVSTIWVVGSSDPLR